MCVIFFAFKKHAEYPLILIANRDEYYSRPTSAAGTWKDHPDVFAGRDLVSGGTWLGITKSGKFAAVTNYRDPSAPGGSVSRGSLVSNFLTGSAGVSEYMDGIRSTAADLSGFNLIVGEIAAGRSTVFYFSNRGGGSVRELRSGVYGLSNHLLDTPWPKVARGKHRFADALAKGRDSDEVFFEILADRERAVDAELPDTGIGHEREKALSSIYIETPDYGTRCSSVLRIDHEGKGRLIEKVFV